MVRISSFFTKVVALFILIAGGSAFVHGGTWDDGGADDEWTTANNWNPNSVPGEFDSAILDTSLGGAVTVTGTVQALEVIFDNSGSNTFTIADGGAGVISLGGLGNLDNQSGVDQTINATVSLGAGSNLDSGDTGTATLTIGTLTLANNSIVGSGKVSLGGVTSNSSSLTVNGAEVTLTGNHQATGGLNVSSGSYIISGSGNYSGGGNISLTGGGLTLAKSNGIADGTDIAISTGRTLTVNGSVTETVGGISGAGNISLGASSALTVNSGNETSTFSGAISGSGAIVKSGSGTLTLSGTNTYSGTTTVSAGTLTVTGGIASSTVSVSSGATLTLNSASADIGGTTLTIGGTVSLSQGEQIANSVNLAFNGGRLNLNNNTETVANITDNGTFILDMGGTGGTFNFNAISDGDLNNVWNIYNYDSNNSTVTFGSETWTSGELSNIKFYSGAGTGYLGTAAVSGSELIVSSTVPEPSTWVSMAGMLLLGVYYYRRRLQAS